MKLPESFEHDLLALEPFADKLKTFLNVERHFVEDGLVVSLTAPFGSGKSSFLQMFKAKMVDEGRTVISLNAWESDYYGDPLFAILSALIEQTPEGNRASIESAAKRFGSLVFNVGKQVVSATTGVDVQEVIESAQANTPMSGNAFDSCRERESALKELKQRLNEYFSQQEEPLLFFVDELDRCRPDYAISYLEVIKHIFDIENTTFVLAFDKKQLENSARHAFGSHLNFDEYLRKFIHREIPLPKVSNHSDFITQYLGSVMEKQGIRRTSVKSVQDLEQRVTELVEASFITPRQVQDMVRQVAYVLQSYKEEVIIRWPYAAIASLLAVLKVSKPKIYDDIKSKKMSLNDMFEFIKHFTLTRNKSWWLTLLVSANATATKKHDVICSYIQENIPKDEQSDWFPHDIAAFDSQWGYFSEESNKLFEIKETLDGLDILLK